MHHLDLKLLRSFSAIAAEGSVTAAARRLNLTQPTVSGQIKELEQTLGFVLFHRNSRSVTLSKQGAAFLPLVRELLESAENVRSLAERMQEDAGRNFRLGAAMYTMDFADRLALMEAFGKAWPQVSHTVDSRLQSDHVRNLMTDRLDAALLLGNAAPMETDSYRYARDTARILNELQYPDVLERVVLRRRRIGLCMSQHHRLAAYDIIPRAELAGENVAMLGPEHGDVVIKPLARFLLANGANPLSAPEGNAWAVERYAMRNDCCAIGLGWFAPLDGMVWRQVEELDIGLDLAIVLGTTSSRAARRFFDFARQWQEDRTAAVGISGPEEGPKPAVVN